MVNNLWLGKAFEVQLEIFPESEELSLSKIRSKSPDKAMKMAGFIHKHLMENAGNCSEYKNILKEVEKFGEDDRVKAIGFFYESTGMNGQQIRVDKLKEVANGWNLGDKFDALLNTFFTGQPTIELLEEN